MKAIAVRRTRRNTLTFQRAFKAPSDSLSSTSIGFTNVERSDGANTTLEREVSARQANGRFSVWSDDRHPRPTEFESETKMSVTVTLSQDRGRRPGIDGGTGA